MSVRESVLAEIERVFQTTTGPGGTTWGRVLDSPPDGLEKKGQNVMSVIEGPEVYLDVVSPDKRDRRLDVELTCIAYIPLGVKLRTGANNVLADIEYIAEANSTWGGFAYSTALQSNDIQRENTADRTVEVSVFIAVQYRTKRSDPRDR